MSSNRSKPTDRGATAPKPSRKVALDEVLRTLQDLVQHELDVGSLPSHQTSSPPAAEAEAAAAPAAEPTTDDTLAIPVAETIVLESPVLPPEDTAPTAATPPPPPVATESTSAATPETLAAAAVPETIEFESPAASPADSTPPAKAMGVTAAPVEVDRPAPPARTPRRRASDRELQQELPYLDAPASMTTPAAAPEVAEPKDSDLPGFDMAAVDWSPPPAEPSVTRDAELSVATDELPSLTETSNPVAAEAAAPATSAPQGAAESLHDIPVLEDAVDFHHEAAHPPGAAPAAETALPAASAARRLAIQVAARLNVTLRKEGKPVLSSELIARLAHELEAALAKTTANMDNNGSKNP